MGRSPRQTHRRGCDLSDVGLGGGTGRGNDSQLSGGRSAPALGGHKAGIETLVSRADVVDPQGTDVTGTGKGSLYGHQLAVVEPLDCLVGIFLCQAHLELDKVPAEHRLVTGRGHHHR